jgi:hypothetical protein
MNNDAFRFQFVVVEEVRNEQGYLILSKMNMCDVDILQKRH